ncbi:MAG TPA: ATP-binding protein [Ktedonobacteraceae bacterium]|nr:ATP-binding protein [Ktedonobacteraceae bacterium]
MQTSNNITYANLMLENMRTGMALYDVQEFRLLAVNNRFKLFLEEYLCPGKSYEIAIGCPLKTLLPQPKEVAKAIINIFRAVVETGESYEIDRFPIPMVGKGLTYWQWTLDPVRDASGTITHLLHSANDVTERVLALQQAEQIYSSLSQTTHNIDAERKRLEVIETVARSVRESFDMKNIGQSATDAIQVAFDPISVSIHVADSIQRKLRLLHIFTASGAEHVKDFLQEVSYDSPLLIAGAHWQKSPIIFENIQAKVQSGKIDSNHITALLNVKGYVCVPLWSGERFEGALAASFRESIRADGAEAKTLEGCGMHIAAALAQARLHAEIEHERARLRAVLAQLPEGIMLVEAPDGRIQYVNAAATEITGMTASAQIDFQMQNAHLAPYLTDIQGNPISPEKLSTNRALRGETINGLETLLTRQNGTEVFLLTSAAPLRTDDGTIIGAIVVFQDITTRKSIEQEKNEFLSITSHELRTPITTIQGFAELLQVRAREPESLNTPQNQRALTSIIDQSKRLTRLIEEILDLSRIESKRMLLNIEPHDLMQTLRQVLENQSMMAKHHTIHLVLDGVTAQDTLPGYFDEDRIIQVLNNLINNAIKYSPDQDEIEVGLRYTGEKPGEALIWVRDYGIGIAAHELPHIYERFHRAGNLDRSISGLGIGLYLVNELVTRHGGHIQVESIDGKGSTFSVTLPLQSAHTR